MTPLVDIDREILALPYSTLECWETPRDAGCINFRAGRSRSLVNPGSPLPLRSGGGAPPIEALAGFDVFRAFKLQVAGNGKNTARDNTDFLDAQPQLDHSLRTFLQSPSGWYGITNDKYA